MPPKKGKKKADDEAYEDEPPAKKPAPPKKGKEKNPDADNEDAPKAKKQKKAPMRRPDYGETIYCVEYAASNRSTCKVCGEKIEQGAVRLGLAVPGKGDWDDISWRHVACHMEPLEISEEETLTSASQIERYGDLEEKDQKELDKWFAEASKAPKKEKAPLKATDSEEPPKGTTLAGSFKEREELGALGAKFDYRSKTWYVPFGKDATPFAKWLGADSAGAIAAHNATAATDGRAGGSQDAPKAPARPVIAPEAVPKMSVGALKEELTARGIEASGKKADLVEKLKVAIENPPPEPAPAPAMAPNPSGRKVDRAVPGAAAYAVHEDYDIKLSESSIVDGANVNKYYFCQVLAKSDGTFASYFKWGKIGETEYGDKLTACADVAAAIKSFEAKFSEKTRGKKDKSPAGEAWAEYKAGNFEKRDFLYGIVETKVGEPGSSGGDDDWQKNLDDKQITKGMEALEAIKAALADEDKAQDKALIAQLSTEYYRAIPTSAGRKAPPPLDSLSVVGEKAHQLEFWLKMGFEETGSKEVAVGDNPIQGIWNKPLPPTLKEACTPYGVSDPGSINSSVARGKKLNGSKAGKPVKPMNAEKYGAIVLYTGNSCYRELNKALREVHSEVPKFMSYLRLLFDAMDAMPTAKVRLWRGIAADLYDEYEPGKIITWWSVSSTTADEGVARGFMSQLGGTASLIILDTKSAMDITPLSVYPNEKESLLAPGTRLKVLSRKRVGKVNEIHVEEVDTAVEPRPAHAVVAVPEPGAAADAEEEDDDNPYSSFSVEPAKSNRSTCKGCFKKIEKGETRIGCELEDLDGEYGGHSITHWRHVACVKAAWIKSLDDLCGFSKLDKAGKTMVQDWHKSK